MDRQTSRYAQAYPNRAAIEAVLPHRGGWVMVERVLWCDNSTIEIVPCIPSNCDEGHFGIIPGVILQEAANQALTLLIYAKLEQLQYPLGLPALIGASWQYFRSIQTKQPVIIRVEYRDGDERLAQSDLVCEGHAEVYKVRPNQSRVLAATGVIHGRMFRKSVSG